MRPPRSGGRGGSSARTGGGPRTSSGGRCRDPGRSSFGAVCGGGREGSARGGRGAGAGWSRAGERLRGYGLTVAGETERSGAEQPRAAARAARRPSRLGRDAANPCGRCGRPRRTCSASPAGTEQSGERPRLPRSIRETLPRGPPDLAPDAERGFDRRGRRPHHTRSVAQSVGAGPRRAGGGRAIARGSCRGRGMAAVELERDLPESGRHPAGALGAEVRSVRPGFAWRRELAALCRSGERAARSGQRVI